MTDSPLPHITGILLAAGLSSRMGKPKQLLPFGNSTIIETVIDNMLASNFNDVRIVIGHCADEIKTQIGNRQVKTLYNPHYREGMLSSVKKGVESLNLEHASYASSSKQNESKLKDRDAFALMLVDQPFITSDLINKTINAYVNTEKGVTLPSYNYRRGHPAIFHHKYAKKILALDTDSGGVRSLFKTYADDIHYVSVDTDDVLRDIDNPDDYENAIKENKSR